MKLQIEGFVIGRIFNKLVLLKIKSSSDFVVMSVALAGIESTDHPRSCMNTGNTECQSADILTTICVVGFRNVSIFYRFFQ